MRTTLNLDDDIAEAVRALARAEHRSLGQVVSELTRRGLAPPPLAASEEDGFPVFQVGADAPPITQEMVDQAIDES